MHRPKENKQLNAGDFDDFAFCAMKFFMVIYFCLSGCKCKIISADYWLCQAAGTNAPKKRGAAPVCTQLGADPSVCSHT